MQVAITVNANRKIVFITRSFVTLKASAHLSLNLIFYLTGFSLFFVACQPGAGKESGRSTSFSSSTSLSLFLSPKIHSTTVYHSIVIYDSRNDIIHAQMGTSVFSKLERDWPSLLIYPYRACWWALFHFYTQNNFKCFGLMVVGYTFLLGISVISVRYFGESIVVYGWMSSADTN